MAKELQHKPVGEVLTSEEYNDPLAIGDTHNLGADHAIGDIVIADVDSAGRNVLRGLAKGTAGKVLMSDGIRPTWEAHVFNIEIKLADDQYLKFGNDDDVSLRWNNGDSKIEITGINIEDLSNVRDIAATDAQALIYDSNDNDWKPVTLHNVVLNPNQGHIGTGDLDTAAVTTEKLDDEAVTTAKIADDAVTAAKLADNSVDTSAIINDAVTTDKIVDGSVTFAKMAEGVGFNATINVEGFASVTRLLDGAIDLPTLETTNDNTNFASFYGFRDFEIGDLADTTESIHVISLYADDAVNTIDVDDIPTRTARAIALTEPTDFMGFGAGPSQRNADTGTSFYRNNITGIGHQVNTGDSQIGRYGYDTPTQLGEFFGRDTEQCTIIAKHTFPVYVGYLADTYNQDSAYTNFYLMHAQLSIYKIDSTLYGSIDVWRTARLTTYARNYGNVTTDALNSHIEAIFDSQANEIVYRYDDFSFFYGGSTIAAGPDSDRDDINIYGFGGGNVPNEQVESIPANRVGIFIRNSVDPSLLLEDSIPATGGSVTAGATQRAIREAITEIQADYFRDRTEILAESTLTQVPAAFTLTEDLTAGQMLVFHIQHSTGVTNVSYDVGYTMLTDEITTLDAQATTPQITAGVGGDLPDALMIGDPTGATNKIYIWKHTDTDKIWIANQESGTYHVKIYRYKLGLTPAGGGGGDSTVTIDPVFIRTLIADWAEADNTSLIPIGKLANVVSNASLPLVNGSETIAPSQKSVRDAIVAEALSTGIAITDNATADRAYADSAISTAVTAAINNADIPDTPADASTTTASTPRAIRQAILDSIETTEGAVSPSITLLDTSDITSTVTAYTLGHDLEPTSSFGL